MTRRPPTSVFPPLISEILENKRCSFLVLPRKEQLPPPGDNWNDARGQLLGNGIVPANSFLRRGHRAPLLERPAFSTGTSVSPNRWRKRRRSTKQPSCQGEPSPLVSVPAPCGRAAALSVCQAQTQSPEGKPHLLRGLGPSRVPGSQGALQRRHSEPRRCPFLASNGDTRVPARLLPSALPEHKPASGK